MKIVRAILDSRRPRCAGMTCLQRADITKRSSANSASTATRSLDFATTRGLASSPVKVLEMTDNRKLARFAANLHFDDIPSAVLQRAEDLTRDWFGSAFAVAVVDRIMPQGRPHVARVTALSRDHGAN